MGLLIEDIKGRLAAYTLRDRQHLLAMLQYFDGQTDLPTVRRVLQESITVAMQVERPRLRERPVVAAVVCPECGRTCKTYAVDGLQIDDCQAKRDGTSGCGWSRIRTGA